MDRRKFLRSVGFACAATAAGRSAWGQAAPRIELLDSSVISQEPQYYHGWPTLARRVNGQLLVVCSGGRQQHVCPFGRVELMTSTDDGATWSWPRVLFDGAIDDRDSGVLETAKGSLLVTWFTSLAYEPALEKASKIPAGEKGAWPEEKLKAWQAAHRRLTSEQRKVELGEWLIRSTDGGLSWSSRVSTIVNSPHGPVQLRDGRLLYAGKELWTERQRAGICQSSDDGQSWHWLAEIPTRPGDDVKKYHELHAVQARDGRVIVHIRNHNPKDEGETLQTESSDAGKSWSEPHSIGVWGLPSFLLCRRDGTLVMTYGYRRPPFGNQARLSTDHGRTWSAPVTISGDGASVDLGYPSTVELADGSLLTVWYEALKGEPHAVLRQARWRLR